MLHYNCVSDEEFKRELSDHRDLFLKRIIEANVFECDLKNPDLNVTAMILFMYTRETVSLDDEDDKRYTVAVIKDDDIIKLVKEIVPAHKLKVSPLYQLNSLHQELTGMITLYTMKMQNKVLKK